MCCKTIIQVVTSKKLRITSNFPLKRPAGDTPLHYKHVLIEQWATAWNKYIHHLVFVIQVASLNYFLTV